MDEIFHEVDALIAEMNALDHFNDDLFIQYYEREEELQERLEVMAKTGKMTANDMEDCSVRLAEAFDKLKSKLSFCNFE